MAYWDLCSGSHQSTFNVSVRLHSLLEFGFSRLPREGGSWVGKKEVWQGHSEKTEGHIQRYKNMKKPVQCQ